MKKRDAGSLLRLLLVLCLILVLSGCDSFVSPAYYAEIGDSDIEGFPTRDGDYKVKADDLGLENMEIMAQDDQAVLYLNTKTTEMAVGRKATGEVWYSNPQDRLDSRDPLAHAQFIVTTLDKRDVAKLWNTYDDSVTYGQFATEKTDQGITVHYLIGKKPEIIIYPAGMTEARYLELLELMPTDKSKNYLKRMYGRVDLTTITSVQQKDQLKTTFTKLESELGGVMYSLKSLLSRLEQKYLAAAFESIQYTQEMRLADEAAVGYAIGGDDGDSFTLSVTYVLENGDLVVKVDPSQIKSSSKLKISEIGILRNFGAQKPGEDGYLFVPDGSGAIISTDQYLTTVWADYKRSVYGQDYGLLRTDRVDYSEQLYLPVYGAYGPKGGFIGIAEQDDGQMAIMAGVAQAAENYSYVYPNFTLLTYAFVSLESSAKNALNIYPRSVVNDPIVLRYRFSDTKDSSYDDLAVMYRNYMVSVGGLDGVNQQRGLAVVANAIGAIDEIESILGYPASVIKELTSFEEVQALGATLTSAAKDADVVINYTGWQRGGMKTGYIKKPETERKLGNGKKLTALAEKLHASGVSLLPVTEQQYCYDAAWGQHFSALNHAIRFITRDTGFKPQHSIANYYIDDGGLKPYIIRPNLVADHAVSFMKAFEPMNISGIGIGVMASELYSDFHAKNVLSMNDTIQYFRQAITTYMGDGNRVSGYGANAYALFGLDYALGLPVASSNHPIISRSVPFLQIVLSGSVSYTMPELNRDADPDRYLLKAIETGSGIYFDYFGADGSAIKDTHYDGLYGAAHPSILEPGSRIAAEASAALLPVANHRILSHKMLESGVYQTTYDNGLTFVVNYNATSRANVPGMGYALVTP